MIDDANSATAKAACTELILGFAYLVDQRRYDELAALFAPDGIFERPGLKATGHGEILAFLNARSLDTETRHICAPPFFGHVGEDRATAVTYVTMFHGPPSLDAAPITVSGVAGLVEFHHVFTRTTAGWRIAHHESRVIMIRAH